MKKCDSAQKISIDDEFAEALQALNAACQHLGRAGVAFNRDLVSIVDVFKRPGEHPEDRAAYLLGEAIGSATRVLANMIADTSTLRRAAEQSRLAHHRRPRYRVAPEARARMSAAQHRRFADPGAKTRQRVQLAQARGQRRQERSRQTTRQMGGALYEDGGDRPESARAALAADSLPDFRRFGPRKGKSEGWTL